MENIGDWLYMVIIIIAAISSIIGSVNKKSRQTSSRETVREDREEKGFRGEQAETQQPVFREIQPEVRQTVRPGYKPLKKNKKTEKDYSIFKKETASAFPNTAVAAEEEEKTAVSLEDMPANTDEWRKAFIYHEVFKRKYEPCDKPD
jgi:hypothetical protein